MEKIRIFHQPCKVESSSMTREPEDASSRAAQVMNIETDSEQFRQSQAES